MGARRELRLPPAGERPGRRRDDPPDRDQRRQARARERRRLGHRLHPRAPRQEDPCRPRLPRGRPRQARQDVLRRVGHARAPRPPARQRTDPPAPRRADQSPRPRGAALVPGLPDPLPGRPRRHLARPRLPQRPLHGHDRASRPAPARIHRQLRRLPGRARGAQAAPAGDVQEPAARDRAPADVRRPLRRQGLDGLPREVQGEADRPPRGGRDRRA